MWIAKFLLKDIKIHLIFSSIFMRTNLSWIESTLNWLELNNNSIVFCRAALLVKLSFIIWWTLHYYLSKPNKHWTEFDLIWLNTNNNKNLYLFNCVENSDGQRRLKLKCLWNKIKSKEWLDKLTFTFMHLADAFIQSDLQCIQVIHFH